MRALRGTVAGSTARSCTPSGSQLQNEVYHKHNDILYGLKERKQRYMPVFAFRLFREGYGVYRFYHRDIPVLLQRTAESRIVQGYVQRRQIRKYKQSMQGNAVCRQKVGLTRKTYRMPCTCHYNSNRIYEEGNTRFCFVLLHFLHRKCRILIIKCTN